jgi:hypothetical protein
MTLIAGPIFDGTANVTNIAAVCGMSHLRAVGPPHVVTMGMPVVAVPMTPGPQGFVVGTKSSHWVEHGFLYLDDESEMSPSIVATVTAVQ